MSSCRADRLLVVLCAAAMLTIAGCRSPRIVREATPSPEAPPVQPEAATVEPDGRRPFDGKASGLAWTRPGTWRPRRQDMALVLQGPMRVPSVILLEPQTSVSAEAVAKSLDKEVGSVIRDMRTTKGPNPITVAGYDAYFVEGTGRAEGFPMRWRATIVQAKRTTLFFALAPQMFWNAQIGAIKKFESSIARAD